MSVTASSSAPQKPPPEPDWVARVADPFRAPLVRHAMRLTIPKKNDRSGLVEVREMKAGVRLSLDVDDDGIGVKHVDLSISETSKLSDMLNAIRRRVVVRKGWLP